MSGRQGMAGITWTTSTKNAGRRRNGQVYRVRLEPKNPTDYGYMIHLGGGCENAESGEPKKEADCPPPLFTLQNVGLSVNCPVLGLALNETVCSSPLVRVLYSNFKPIHPRRQSNIGDGVHFPALPGASS